MKKSPFRIRIPELEEIPGYSLIYYLTPETFYIPGTPNPGIKISKLWNTVFMSSGLNKRFTITPSMPAKFIDISFTRNWLDSQTGETNDFFNIENVQFPDLSKPVFFFETSNSFEKKMIEDIFNTPDGPEVNPLFLKSRAIAIIKEFISKVSKRDFSIAQTTNHSFEIAKVEARLLASVSGALPSLKELAIEFCLSESTLKREFKKITGQSISQYFMQKKMEYAYKLFSEKNGNVSEIACRLGYEKVSRFIAMFKKHHGISPGKLLQLKQGN